LLLALVAGCGPSYSIEGMTRTESEELADRVFREERWYRASLLYTELMFRFPGAPNTDMYLYKLAYSEMRQKHWADAEFNFRRVTREFPNSRFADDAQLGLVECNWRQRKDYRRDISPVQRALEELTLFYDTYPGSDLMDRAEQLRRAIYDLLARRALFIGRFYARRDEYDAALLYLQEASQSYDSPSCTGEIYLAMADIYLELGNEYSARNYYLKALEEDDLSEDQMDHARIRLESL
jgi:outer membrane protein assembly factor BamD